MRKILRWIRFNLFYLGTPPWDTGVSPPELIDFLESTPPGQALDVGCGTGTNLVSMASYGWRVVGIDIAWVSVLKARVKLKKAGLDGQVKHGDLAGRLWLESTFDLVLDIGCYHSLSSEERDAYLKKLKRWMNPNGTFLIYAHRKASPTDTHGVTDADFDIFSGFLNLQWRQDNDERRPDGGGGRPATWARFEKGSPE